MIDDYDQEKNNNGFEFMFTDPGNMGSSKEHLRGGEGLPRGGWKDYIRNGCKWGNR